MKVAVVYTMEGCPFCQQIKEELKKNNDIVLAAVKQNGLALAFASQDLKSNKDFMLAAL